MQHRRHDRHGPHAEPSERHELQLLRVGSSKLFDHRSDGICVVSGEQRIDRGVTIGQEWRKPRSVGNVAVVAGDGRTTVRFRVAVNVRV